MAMMAHDNKGIARVWSSGMKQRHIYVAVAIMVFLQFCGQCSASNKPHASPRAATNLDRKLQGKNAQTSSDGSSKRGKGEKKKKNTSISSANISKPVKGSTEKENATANLSPTVRRIRKEYKDVVKMGIAYDWAKGEPIRKGKKSEYENIPIAIGPLSTNLKHWHFSFRGVGVYAGGVYHGKIMLPKDYPSSPPRVQVWTPSGRYKTYHDICLSASSFHPETWSPKWTVLGLVQSLRIHMLTNPHEVGGMSSSADVTERCAHASLTWRVNFRTNSNKVRSILIDHGKMLKQGVLQTDEDLDDDSSESLANIPSQTAGNETANEIQSESEARPPVDTDGDAEDGQNDVSDRPAPLADDQENTSSGEQRPQSDNEQAVKSKKRAKKQKVAFLPAKLPAAETPQHIIILFASKLIASPLRVAIISFLLLAWILAIP